MKKHLLTSAFLLLTSISLFSQNAIFDWAKKMSGTASETTYKVATDAAGNVYSAGYFSGTVNFNPGGSYLLTSLGLNDGFVSKLDANGNFVWAFKLGSTLADEVKSIAVDATGNVFVCGSFKGTVNFNPSGTANLTSAGQDDIFIAKYDSNGNYQWAKRMGSTLPDIAYDIALDASSNVHTTGYYLGTVNFNPGGTFNMTSAGDADVFVSKLDASGNFVWAKSMGGTLSDIAYGITVDAAGNVITTGYFDDIADFDPSGVSNTLTTAGGNDIFISKLSSTGAYTWAKRMGGTLGDEAGSVCTDALGNVYAGGRFQDIADFGSTLLTSAGAIDGYVTKLNPSGTFMWAKQLGGTLGDAVYGIATDASGNVYSTGYFNDVADFNPSFNTNSLTSSGSFEVFISKLDNAGNYGWAKKIGGTGADFGHGIHLTSTGTIYAVGSFSGTANFNPDGTFNMVSAGNSDAFVLKLQPCANTFGSISPTACLSYTLNSQTYTTTGTYTQNLTNAAGCDSTLTINLRISNINTSISSQTNATCIGGNQGSATISANGGILPYSYSWTPSGGTSVTAVNLGANTYTCTVTDSIGCTKPQIVTITQPSQTQIPDICMVTTDAQSVNNIVYWDRTLYPQADSFVVYREVSTNVYLRIGAVSIDSISEFIDTTRSVGPANGDPNVGSYRYKLQLLDTCGNYSAMSPYHNTIYIIDAGLGQFTWSIPYTIEGGGNPVANYILLCDTANVDVWGPVATVAGTQSSAVDPGFSNHAAIANWRIKTAWGITCDPTRATINTTRSNIKRGSMVTGINEFLTNNVIIYPNPASNYITIQQPQFLKASSISIYNALGELVYQASTTNLTETINTENFAKGVYTVTIQTQVGNVFKKLVIQ